MAPLSRRTFAAFLGIAALTPVLGGCASSATGTASGSGDTGTVSDAGAAASGSGMRTVDTDKGPVEIPANPQTIVTDYYLGEFLAVDAKPVIGGAVRWHRGAEHHVGRDLPGDDRREAARPHRHHHRGRLR